MLYDLVRPLLFRAEAEDAHERVVGLLERLERRPRLLETVRSFYEVDAPAVETEALGLSFPNPVGIAAGFDKDARVARALPALGFGFVEVGTVTRYPQEGNPRPRMWRFPEQDAIVNSLGFPNEGADAVSTRLAQEGRPSVPLGVNVGLSKRTDLEDAEDDYRYSVRRFHDLADFLVVNVSSPNTPGLRSLQGREHLDGVLAAVQEANHGAAEEAGVDPRPTLVKVSPDLPEKALAEVVDVARDRDLAGIVATNTTEERVEGVDVEEGGMSGAPLARRSTEVVARLHQLAGERLAIVGVGGVATAEDALEKIEAGASLVQLYTGLVYGGPATPSRINRELAGLVADRGANRVGDLVGRRADELALESA
jgi:dihydroorotate dehydrogenase